MTFNNPIHVAKKSIVFIVILAMLVSSIPALMIPSTAEAQAVTKATPFSWDNATVYFVMTDRFWDGDPSNNHSYGRELDQNGKPYPGYQEKIGSFHGGDLKGLTLKLNEGYFNELGVNALWITSPLEQIYGYVGGFSFRHYGYHGYFPLDFTEIDKNMGSVEDLRTFIDTAHSKGIRVLFDVVINHVGYGDLITMDRLGFGDPKSAMFDNKMMSWQEYYYRDSFNSTNKSEWSAHFDHYTKFIGNTETSAWAQWWGPDWMRAHNTPGYAPCGTGELDMCLANLPDFKTESTKEVGLPPIMLNKWDAAKEAKEIAELDAFFKRTGKKRTVANHMIKWITDWVREYGVDGFRLDTAKHVENHVWADLKDEATIALREWKKNNPTKKIDDTDFWMTGEVFGHKVEKTAYFTEGKYDSIINFDFLWDNVPAMVPNQMSKLDAKYVDYAQKMNNDPTFAVLNQLSSHDTTLYGTDYAQAQKNNSAGTINLNERSNNINAATTLMLAPGAAQIYYGDESGRPYGHYPDSFADRGIRCFRADRAPAEQACDLEAGTRSRMNWNSLNQNYLDHWRIMGKFRANHIAIGAGQHRKLQDGPYAFSRTYNQDGINDTIVAAIEAKGASTIDVSTVWSNGTLLRDYYTGSTATVQNGKVTFTAGKHGVILIENANAPAPQTAVFASPPGGDFTSSTQQIKLVLRNATSGKYTIDGRDPKTSGVNFVSGDVITIGSTMKIGDSLNLRMYTNGSRGEDTESYIFKKMKRNQLTIHFKKPADWGTPQLFYYDAKPSAPGVSWDGAPSMVESGNGYFTFTIQGANTATILFKDRSGKQLPAPGQAGFARTIEGYYDNGTWKDGNPNGKPIDDPGDTGPAPEPPPAVNPALPIPLNVKLTKQELTSLSFTWPAVDSKDVVGYNIYRNGGKVGTTTGTTFTDSGLSVDTDYQYAVHALDASGKVSEPSEHMIVSTLADGDVGTIEDPDVPIENPDDGSTIPEDIAVVEVTDSQFETALGAVKNGLFQYNVTSDEEQLRVKFTAEMIELAKSSATTLRVRTSTMWYDLPLNEFDFDALAAELKVPAGELSVYVTFLKADEQIDLDFEVELEKMQVKKISAPVMFRVDVQSAGSKAKRIDEYKSSFAARTFPIETSLEHTRLSVVQYDAIEKKVRFAPATFTLLNGKQVPTTRINHHPWLAVIESSRTFTDLGSVTATVRNDIQLLASKRLLNGINQRQFGPNNLVTRAEFATMLVNALGLKPNKNEDDMPFGDVWPAQWYFATVNTAVNYKLVAGMSDGTFRPNDTITRQQMAVMIGNAMRLAKTDLKYSTSQMSSTLALYADRRTIGGWAQSDMARALRSGIIVGTRSNNVLNAVPNQQIRRAEAASSIRRMMSASNFLNK